MTYTDNISFFNLLFLRHISVYAAIFVVAVLGGCGAPAGTAASSPKEIFPGAPAPDAFSRAYSLTESPDGRVRVFARERRDETILYEMRLQPDGSWSQPEPLGFPRLLINSGPSFSHFDGHLYFASDATLPSRGTGKDLNIWRAAPLEEGWSVAEPLSDTINTGARETSPAMDASGILYFATDHPRAGGGGLDIMAALPDLQTGDWQLAVMPDGFNSPRHDTHLAVTSDGNVLFFYSHREPKAGSVDIWMARKGEDGQWTIPVNPGSVLNTQGIDFGPGLSGDNKTFFFSRDGVLMQMPLGPVLAGAGSGA